MIMQSRSVRQLATDPWWNVLDCWLFALVAASFCPAMAAASPSWAGIDSGCRGERAPTGATSWSS